MNGRIEAQQMAAEHEAANPLSKEYKTLSWLPEVSAAALRVIVLDNEESGIDTLPGWVRFRIEDAARSLDECAKRMAALEKYVELVIGAEKKAFASLVEETADDALGSG